MCCCAQSTKMRINSGWCTLRLIAHALQLFMLVSEASPVNERSLSSTTTPFTITFDGGDVSTGTILQGNLGGTGFDFSGFTVFQFKETITVGSSTSALGRKDNFLRPASAPNYIGRTYAGLQDSLSTSGTFGFKLTNELINTGATFELKSLYYGCFLAVTITQGNFIHSTEPIAPLIIPVNCKIRFRSTKYEPLAARRVILDQEETFSTQITIGITNPLKLKITNMAQATFSSYWSGLTTVEVAILEAELPEAGVLDSLVDAVVGGVNKASGGITVRVFGFGLDSLEGVLTKIL
ncbi:hypothetical protein ABW21_db0204289 [Orbilia brochopaga]|nr:hypothetical protein ABW21_db0204289 [Drechslerella brochopaga]